MAMVLNNHNNNHNNNTEEQEVEASRMRPTFHSLKSMEEEDAVYADMGVLFEGSLPSTVKRFEFPSTLSSSGSSKSTSSCNKSIQVTLHVVDDDPGALQSGHCLWPAAEALCDYMTTNNTKKKNHHHRQHLTQQPKSILELGAGCGLVSLVALQQYVSSLQCLIVTDRDPRTLVRARDSYESTLEDLYERYDDQNNEQEEQQLEYCINELGSIPVEFETLEWGSRHCQKLNDFMTKTMANHNLLTSLSSSSSASEEDDDGEDVDTSKASSEPTSPSSTTTTTTTTATTTTKIDMILGSDLIYCAEVVEPLFQTAVHLMHDTSLFWLSQSFVYDPETEDKLDEMCEMFQLKRTILVDDLNFSEQQQNKKKKTTKNGAKIQEFTKKRRVTKTLTANNENVQE